MTKNSKKYLSPDIIIIILLLILLLIIMIKILIDNKKCFNKEKFIDLSCSAKLYNNFYYPNIPLMIDQKQEDVINFFTNCGNKIPFAYGFTGSIGPNSKIIKQQYKDSITKNFTDFKSINSYDKCKPSLTDKNPKKFEVLFTLG